MKITEIFCVLCIGAGLVYGLDYAAKCYRNFLVPPLTPHEVPYIYLPGHDVEEHATVLHPGERFVLRTITKRSLQCDVSLDYSIAKLEDRDGIKVRTIFYSYPTIESITIIGESITDRYFEIPDWLPSKDDYILVRHARYHCDGEQIFQQAPPIPIHIE